VALQQLNAAARLKIVDVNRESTYDIDAGKLSTQRQIFIIG
jgi:hypothetical protein